MTLPQVNALAALWRHVPPPAVQLRRLALALGIPEPKAQAPARSPQDALREAAQAGLPIVEGRPDDPLLAFLDD